MRLRRRYIIGMVVMIILTGCRGRDIGNRPTTDAIVTQVAELVNLRYTGLEDVKILDKLDDTCTLDVAIQLKNDLYRAYKIDTKYDITERYNNVSNKLGLGCTELIENGINDKGQFMTYIDTAKVSLNYPDYESVYYRLYDDRLILTREDIVLTPKRYIDNEYYNLGLEYYRLYNDGELELSFISASQEYRNRQKVRVRIDEDGKICEADSNDFVCRLDYE